MAKALIYTKNGDKGETSTVDGSRVSKADAWIELYGEADELNSWIGVVRSSLPTGVHASEDAELQAVQNRLFDLGSNLACKKDARLKYKLPGITEAQVKALEEGIDRMSEKLPALTNFVLPAGHMAASQAHVCRTVCRRLERKMTADLPNLPEKSLEFVNRLSDYLFVLARFINWRAGHPETAWKP